MEKINFEEIKKQIKLLKLEILEKEKIIDEMLEILNGSDSYEE